jgi:low temperature requirement protein LtrA
VSPDDQKVTFVELFFDLVFVYCITQVATLLHGHIDWRSAGSALLVFWLAWWAWTQFTWALNAANTEHPRIQAIMLAATVIAFLLAVAIPSALGYRRALVRGSVRGAARSRPARVRLGASRDPAQRKAVRIFAVASTTGLVAVVAGAGRRRTGGVLVVGAGGRPGSRGGGRRRAARALQSSHRGL